MIVEGYSDGWMTKHSRIHFRRKFRSQTSDNMERWKSRGGKSQRREEKKREGQRRERVRSAGARKGRKVAKHCVFQWFVAPDDRKVGSLKRPVRSHLAGWEVKKCMPLWREAHFEVKKLKTPRIRSTFGSWDVEKVHAVGAKHTSEGKCTKHTMLGALLSWDDEKVRAVVVRSTCHVKNTTCSHHFWTYRCRFAWPAQGIQHLVKSEQNVKVLSHFQKRWQAWGIWRGSAKMHFPWQAHVHQRCYEVWALISWERVAFWSIRSSVLGRWFCVTGAALRMTWHQFFGRRNTLET